MDRKSETPLKQPLIMIVDDDTDIRVSVTEALENEGYEVEVVSNGLLALEHLREGVRPGLIILDLSMPIMDGSEFRRMQLSNPEWARIPICVLSAQTRLQERAEYIGVQNVLAKPVDLGLLLATVARLYKKAS